MESLDLLSLLWVYGDCVSIVNGKGELPSKVYSERLIYGLSMGSTKHTLESISITGDKSMDDLLMKHHCAKLIKEGDLESEIENLLAISD